MTDSNVSLSFCDDISPPQGGWVKHLDCTYGRGGHAKEILKHLGRQGKLIALDRDLDAVNVGKRIKDKRFVIEHCAFSEMDQILKKKILLWV